MAEYKRPTEYIALRNVDPYVDLADYKQPPAVAARIADKEARKAALRTGGRKPMRR
jgi:hypothetical protein